MSSGVPRAARGHSISDHVIVVAEPGCLCDADLSLVPNEVRSAKGDVSVAHEGLPPHELDGTHGARLEFFAHRGKKDQKRLNFGLPA